MEESRTKNVIRNISAGFIIQILNKIVAFIVRMFFIQILNTEYLGVNGLFTNILKILSFAELGIGTAIIYNMYKPVAEHNQEEIKSLIKLYKRAYALIGFFIFLVGMAIIPFLGIIIKDVPNIKENIIIIYILFLINTCSSYFFTHKRAIISAHQQERIISKYEGIFSLIRSVAEIIFLIITHNYIVYLLVELITTTIMNIAISQAANKLFPYLKEKNIKKLTRGKIQEIFFNVKDLAIYKFGSAIMDGTDNILITMIVNIQTVGLCSNYTLVISSLKTVISSALNGIIGSVGNLNASSEKQKKEDVFYEMQFTTFWIYAFCSTALIVLLNDFIRIWLGDGYVMTLGIAIALTMNFFISGTRFPAFTYRVTTGLFKKAKIAPFVCALLNIILSVIMGKIWGATGIFVATSIAQLLSISWIDPFLIHKYLFKSSYKKYFKRYLRDFIVFVLACFITYFISTVIGSGGIIKFLLKILIVIIVPNLIIYICFYRTKEFQLLKERLAFFLMSFKKENKQIMR